MVCHFITFGVSKNIVSSPTRVGAMGPSQTRENPTGQCHFPIHLCHLYNNSGKHKSRNRRDVLWCILIVSEYYRYERHSVCSCSEPCNNIVYKRIYAADRRLTKEICEEMRDFRFTPLCTWGFRSFGTLGSVGWQPLTDTSAQPIGLTVKYQAVQEDGTDWRIEVSVGDNQTTRHIGPDLRKPQVRLVVPKTLWPPAILSS